MSGSFIAMIFKQYQYGVVFLLRRGVFLEDPLFPNFDILCIFLEGLHVDEDFDIVVSRDQYPLRGDAAFSNETQEDEDENRNFEFLYVHESFPPLGNVEKKNLITH